MNESQPTSASQTAPPRRLKAWHVIAGALLITGGIYLALRGFQLPAIIQQQTVKIEREEQFNRQLEQFVELNFGRPVMLKAWLEEWSRQTGIPVEVRHPMDISTAEIAGAPISLDLPAIPARRALDSLGQQYGADWEHQEHERIILHWYRRDALEMQHEIAIFPGPDCLAFNYPA